MGWWLALTWNPRWRLLTATIYPQLKIMHGDADISAIHVRHPNRGHARTTINDLLVELNSQPPMIGYTCYLQDRTLHKRAAWDLLCNLTSLQKCWPTLATMLPYRLAIDQVRQVLEHVHHLAPLAVEGLRWHNNVVNVNQIESESNRDRILNSIRILKSNFEIEIELWNRNRILKSESKSKSNFEIESNLESKSIRVILNSRRSKSWIETSNCCMQHASASLHHQRLQFIAIYYNL